MSKREEYLRLEKEGIRVPRWVLLTETEQPDLSAFHDYVVRKPDYGGRGAQVKAVRKDKVKWKPGMASSLDDGSSSMLIQEFVYTGHRPQYFRVKTLFGKALYSVKFTASAERPQVEGLHHLQDAMRTPGFSIVASGAGNDVALNYDEEVIRFAESAHAAFPEIPLLGFDIVREQPSGKLYALEANAIGYVWYFHANEKAEFGFSIEEQFDGVRKAAYILAEKTQQEAR
jgi:hypothetical protein